MEFPTDKSAKECSDLSGFLIFTVSAVNLVFGVLSCNIFTPEYIESDQGANIGEPN